MHGMAWLGMAPIVKLDNKYAVIYGQKDSLFAQNENNSLISSYECNLYVD